jgi:LEA14-like dessication related protein
MKRLLLLPILAALALAGCSGFGKLVERPNVDLVAVDVVGLTLTTAELSFEFQVRNPNRMALVLEEIRYHLRLAGKPFSDERYGERVEIPGLGRGRVRLPVTVRYQDVARLLGKLFSDRPAPYEIAADFRFDLPVVGGITVPLRERGELPSLRPKFLR